MPRFHRNALEPHGLTTDPSERGGIRESNRVRRAGEGSFAYYLNPGGTQPLSGTLRAGRMRLRVRVALVEEPRAPVFPMTFRLTIGSHVIEGPVDGVWPT